MTSVKHDDHSSNYNNKRSIQAVILAGGEGSALFPLATKTGKSLLPVSGVPLLSYQLRVLEKAGYQHVIVVCGLASAEDMSNYVTQSYVGEIRVTLRPVAEDIGTIRALCSVKDLIVNDVLVISGDVITNVALDEICNIHRIEEASLTMLVKEFKVEGKDDRKILRKVTKNILNYIGLEYGKEADRAQVVLMKNATIEDPLDVPKHLLVRHPDIKVHTNMVDAHVYILRSWVFKLLCSAIDKESDDPVSEAIEGMASLRSEFLPFFINKLQPRCNPEAIAKGVEEVPFFNTRDSSRELAAKMSGALAASSNTARCFAYIASSSAIVSRVNTLYAYSKANVDITGATEDKLPWPTPKPYPNTTKTTVGRETTIGQDAQFYCSVIGAHCVIGSNVKLSNVVVMDHCTIGDDVEAQNTIFGSNVGVEPGCNFVDVQVEAGCNVGPKGLRLKSQAFTSGIGAETF